MELIEMASWSFPFWIPMALFVTASARLAAARSDKRFVAASTSLLLVGLYLFGLLYYPEAWTGDVSTWRHGLAGLLAGCHYVLLNVAAGLVVTVFPVKPERATIGVLLTSVLVSPFTGVALLGAECSLGNCL